MIKAVIFDMFETLISYYEGPIYFGTDMSVDADVPVVPFLEQWRATENDRTLGVVSIEEVLEKILKDNNRYSEARLQKIMKKRIEAQDQSFWYLNSEIRPLLAILKARGISVGLISNCFREEAESIRKSILFPYFDAAMLSCELGIKKPEKEIYYRCTEALGVKPEECIYIGDGGSEELEGARSVGMKPYQASWYLKEIRQDRLARKAEFQQLETPLDVLKVMEKENDK